MYLFIQSFVLLIDLFIHSFIIWQQPSTNGQRHSRNLATLPRFVQLVSSLTVDWCLNYTAAATQTAAAATQTNASAQFGMQKTGRTQEWRSRQTSLIVGDESRQRWQSVVSEKAQRTKLSWPINRIMQKLHTRRSCLCWCRAASPAAGRTAATATLWPQKRSRWTDGLAWWQRSDSDQWSNEIKNILLGTRYSGLNNLLGNIRENWILWRLLLKCNQWCNNQLVVEKW